MNTRVIALSCALACVSACAPLPESDKTTLDYGTNSLSGYRVLWKCTGKSFSDSTEALVFSYHQSETAEGETLLHVERQNITSNSSVSAASSKGLLLTRPATVGYDYKTDVTTINVAGEGTSRSYFVTYDAANRTLYYDLSFGSGMIDCANMIARQ